MEFVDPVLLVPKSFEIGIDFEHIVFVLHVEEMHVVDFWVVIVA